MQKRFVVLWLGLGPFLFQNISSTAQELPTNVIDQKMESPGRFQVATLTFTEVTTAANIVTESSGTHGVSIADLDGDGFPEIYICSQEDNKIPITNYMGNFLFKNNGNGTFSRIDASAGVQDIPSWAHASIFFDMDRDGDFDFAVGHGLDGLTRRGLFRNNGNLTFTPVDATAGFQNTGDIGTRAIIAGDLNGDDLMDIHFSSFNGFDTEGYLGDGAGQFTRDFGLNDKPRSIQGLTAGDLDGDGDLDVMMGNFTSNDGVGYYRNNGSGVFTRVLTSGLPTTGSSFTAINLADVDADGDLDVLLVGEGLGAASLYLNNGSGTSFTLAQQMTLQTGCTGGCGGDNGAFGDFDNDGDPDLFLPGAVQKIWLNNGAGSFTGVNDASSGVSYTFEDSRFPALFDYDRDGDLDLFLAQHDAAALLFRNNLNDNRAVRLRPTGPLGDKGGFGTKAWVYEAGHLDDPAFLISYQEAMASGGYCIQHEPILHFGVGSNASVDVRVKFIDGSSLVLTGVTPGQTIDVAKPSNVVLSPNGGESFVVGQSISILWAFDASITNVKLEFSTDNGLNWQVIASSTSNDGGFTWTVPNQASTQCLVRISDAADGDPLDVSDAVFAIVPLPPAPTITSFAPESGEVSVEVTIIGTNFTGASSVQFNGAPAASFVVDSDVQIRATVPSGATTGKISVTTTGGTAFSATDFAVTASGSTTITFQPIHGAYVKSSSANSNYGSATTLRVRKTSTETLNTYLKFEVAGISGAVQSATLRLYVSDASTDGGGVYAVSNNYAGTSTPWVESGLNWNNAPVITGAALSSAGAVSVGNWVELEVTAAITGDGTYSFALSNNTSNVVYYTSDEGTNKPELVIQYAAGSTPAPSLSSFTPTSGPVGTEVTITGANLAGASSVQFNGAPAASVAVDSDVQIRATVPSGATTGKITVTTAGGTAVSAEDFTVTTGGSTTTLTLQPLHDTYVKFSSPTSSFGGASTLRLRKSSTETINMYLKFEVTGLTGAVQSAKLRLYVTDASNDGGGVYSVSNNYQGTTNAWTQSGLNWNNAPEISETALSSAGAVSVGMWVEFEVTAAISGNGVFSFGLKNEVSDVVYYSSKEGANKPELVIQTSADALRAQTGLSADAITLPEEFSVSPSYPNPFNSRTTIEYMLPQEATVRLVIYNILGQAVRALVDEAQTAGRKTATWDGRGEQGQVVGSGVYFYQIQIGMKNFTGKMLLQQ